VTTRHRQDGGVVDVLDTPVESESAPELRPFGADLVASGGTSTAVADEDSASTVPVGIVLPPPIGAQLHRSRFARRGFMKVVREGAPTTTRQAEVLNTAIIGSPTDERGVVIGIDRISAAMIAHDPFTAYEAKTITSPNVCVLGMLGSGKALDVDTPIATPTGWTRMGDLAVGDYVFDEAGRPTRIVAVSDVMTGRECFGVRFSDGTEIVADADHLWSTVTHLDRHRPRLEKTRPRKRRRVGTAEEIARCRELLVTEPDRIANVAQIICMTGTPAGRGRSVYDWLYGMLRERAGYRLAYALPVILEHLERPMGSPPVPPREPVSTRQVRDSLVYNGQTNHAVPVCAPLNLPAVDLLVDGYVLGAWLGDGTSAGGTITTADPEMILYIEAAGYVTAHRGDYLYSIRVARTTPPANVEAVCVGCDQPFTTTYHGQRACSRGCQVRRDGVAARTCLTCDEPLPKGSTGWRHRACFTAGTFIGQLAKLGVMNNKHVPEQYMWASEEQRRALLAGLLDTDGTVSPRGAVQFTACNERLAHQVRELCCSLGYRPAVTSRPARFRGRSVSTAWTVSFTTTDDVFRLERKRLALKERTQRFTPERNRYRYIIDIEPVETRPVRCIQVEAGSSMYLAGKTMVATHNSSLIKTVYVERPLLLRDRRAVVVDKKPRNGEGEYADLTRRFGGEPFRFEPGERGNGSTCMNVLDEVILAGGGAAQQVQLLAAMAQQAGTGELDEWHHKSLRSAYRAVMRRFELGVPGRSSPVLPDLVQEFAVVVDSDEFARLRPATLDLVEERAWSMRLRFERMLGEDLEGMFDRETSKHVVLHPKLTTFDISALPEDGPATSMVMVVANAWLMGMLTKHRGLRTNFIAEEGWHLLGGPGGKVIRSKSKLSRGLGLSIIAAIHHISDIPADSEAIAMIKEAQTIHLFRQEHDDDIADCVRYFNLEHSNGASLGTLQQGDHLLKVGTQKEIKVQHIRTANEIVFTETDSAMITQPTSGVVGS